nr:tRNA (guanine(10)-N2)-methyltransferase [Seculamonas ecuadoriensis]
MLSLTRPLSLHRLPTALLTPHLPPLASCQRHRTAAMSCSSSAAAASAALPIDALFLMCLRNEEVRIPELESCAKVTGARVQFGALPRESVYLRAKAASVDDVIRVARRSIMCKSAVEVIGTGETVEELAASIESNAHLLTRDMTPETTFRMTVTTFEGRLSKAQQSEIMKSLYHLPFVGKVDLKNASVNYYIIEDMSTHRSDGFPKYYFGRFLTNSDRDSVYKYRLNARKYIGTTSMDPELAMVMANLGLARPNSLMLDPFVGTGGLIVAAAHYGSEVFGSELDGRVLRGTVGIRIGSNIWENFDQYELPQPQALIRNDWSQCMWRNVEWFDSIICDPPYGVREPARVIGVKANRVIDTARVEESVSDGTYVPQRVLMGLDRLFLDLLDFAARLLVVDGRLVFWLPTTFEYTPDDLPAHPALRLLCNFEQPLSTRWGRRLLAYEKLRAPLPGEQASYKEGHIPSHVKFRDHVFRDDVAYERLGAEALQDPDMSVREQQKWRTQRRAAKREMRARSAAFRDEAASSGGASTSTSDVPAEGGAQSRGGVEQ